MTHTLILIILKLGVDTGDFSWEALRKRRGYNNNQIHQLRITWSYWEKRKNFTVSKDGLVERWYATPNYQQSASKLPISTLPCFVLPLKLHCYLSLILSYSDSVDYCYSSKYSSPVFALILYHPLLLYNIFLPLLVLGQNRAG